MSICQKRLCRISTCTMKSAPVPSCLQRHTSMFQTLSLTSNKAPGQHSTMNRIRKELKLMQKDPPCWCSAGLKSDSDMHHWEATITGPTDTPFRYCVTAWVPFMHTLPCSHNPHDAAVAAHSILTLRYPRSIPSGPHRSGSGRRCTIPTSPVAVPSASTFCATSGALHSLSPR